MTNKPTSASATQDPPADYEAAMADIEERAARGALSITQVKQEIFALRERFAVDAGVVTQWAMRGQPAVVPAPARAGEAGTAPAPAATVGVH
jgi:hypothetical protein